MIAAAPAVGYIHEPFNPTHRPGICAAQTDRYFLDVQDDCPRKWASALQKTVSFRYDAGAEWSSIRTPKDALRMVRDASTFAWHRLCGNRALLKDPIALFSAEWIAKTFDADVVVLMRHPAAFVSSLKRLGWSFPFRDLTSQSRLLERRLAPYSNEIREFAQGEHDIVDQGALLWRIFAYTIRRYQEENEDWLFLRHEDLSRAPINEFRSVYEYLDLSFSESVRKVVRSHSTSENVTEVEADTTHQLHRDSQTVTNIWRTRLTDDEIGRIRTQVGEEISPFYSDESWSE